MAIQLQAVEWHFDNVALSLCKVVLTFDKILKIDHSNECY